MKKRPHNVKYRNAIRLDREQFIKNISGSYSDVVEDLDTVRKILKKFMTKLMQKLNRGN
jgi:hypothetical protein